MKDIMKHIKNNKYNIIIKCSIICVLCSIIYLLYYRINKINENFVSPSTTGVLITNTTSQTRATNQIPTTTSNQPTTTQSPTTTSNNVLMDKAASNLQKIIKDIQSIAKISNENL